MLIVLVVLIVLVFTILVFVVLVFFVLFVGRFDFFDINMSGGFDFLFSFRVVFIIELGAADLGHSFDAVLGLFVFGFNERRRKRGDLIVTEVRIAAAVLGGHGIGSDGLSRCRQFFRFRSSGLRFGAGFGKKPAGQAARKTTGTRSLRSTGSWSARLRGVVYGQTGGFLRVFGGLRVISRGTRACGWRRCSTSPQRRRR